MVRSALVASSWECLVGGPYRWAATSGSRPGLKAAKSATLTRSVGLALSQGTTVTVEPPTSAVLTGQTPVTVLWQPATVRLEAAIRARDSDLRERRIGESPWWELRLGDRR